MYINKLVTDLGVVVKLMRSCGERSSCKEQEKLEGSAEWTLPRELCTNNISLHFQLNQVKTFPHYIQYTTGCDPNRKIKKSVVGARYCVGEHEWPFLPVPVSVVEGVLFSWRRRVAAVRF